jgi:hypothetical protein
MRPQVRKATLEKRSGQKSLIVVRMPKKVETSSQAMAEA